MQDRVAHSRINAIRNVISSAQRQPVDYEDLIEHLEWAVLMLDSAAELFEEDVRLHEMRCGWLRALDRDWYAVPKWEGSLPEWHVQQQCGPRLTPEQWSKGFRDPEEKKGRQDSAR